MLLESIYQVIGFTALLVAAAAALEAFLYFHFRFYGKKWFFAAGLSGAAGLSAALWPFIGLNSFAAFLLSALGAELLLLLAAKYLVKGRHMLAYMLLAPAFVGISLLILYPLAFEIKLAFQDLKLTTIMQWSATGQLPFAGLDNFRKVFTSSPLSSVTFWQLLLRTLWWTFVNVFFHVAGGFALALLLNSGVRFKGVYRMLLIVPWAMPQVVAVLAMRGEFHSQYGFINIMLSRLTELLPFLQYFHIGPVQWLSNHAFLTCTIINVWLGIPFMAVIILGGLQSISRHYYDAAEIDGATAFQKFRMVTLPLIRPVLAPAVTLGTVWTFNNINVIYLVTGQAGGTEDADILVSALYKAAFTYFRYSYSAALAIVIFIILFAISLLWLQSTKATESVY